jgi:hypothetical protein
MTPQCRAPIKAVRPSATGRCAAAALALAGLLALCSVACTSRPDGPHFRRATEPGSDQSLVYIYRTQSLGGIPAFDLGLDSQDIGELRDGEYLSFTLTPGRHVLTARLRWWGLFPRAWNQLEFVANPGQTVYLGTWASYRQHDDPANPIRQATGGEATGSVGVFIAQRRTFVAALELPSMRRAPGR